MVTTTCASDCTTLYRHYISLTHEYGARCPCYVQCIHRLLMHATWPATLDRLLGFVVSPFLLFSQRRKSEVTTSSRSRLDLYRCGPYCKGNNKMNAGNIVLSSPGSSYSTDSSSPRNESHDNGSGSDMYRITDDKDVTIKSASKARQLRYTKRSEKSSEKRKYCIGPRPSSSQEEKILDTILLK